MRGGNLSNHNNHHFLVNFLVVIIEFHFLLRLITREREPVTLKDKICKCKKTH